MMKNQEASRDKSEDHVLRKHIKTSNSLERGGRCLLLHERIDPLLERSLLELVHVDLALHLADLRCDWGKLGNDFWGEQGGRENVSVEKENVRTKLPYRLGSTCRADDEPDLWKRSLCDASCFVTFIDVRIYSFYQFY
jgi:hypothetical protein